MKILAISGVMLAAAATLVSAAPAKEETGERVSYTESDKKPAADEGDWVELASPTPASHGREIITAEGRYTQLRIDAHKGRPIVKAVKIIYADGSTKTKKIDRILGGKRPTALVDLSGADVHHVVVITERKSKATYTVSASKTTGVAAR